MTPVLRPVCRPGALDPDTQLGRPGAGCPPAAAPPPVECVVTGHMLLVNGARIPEQLRAHLAHTLAQEDVQVEFAHEGDDLRATLTGGALAVEGAMDALPRLYATLRRPSRR